MSLTFFTILISVTENEEAGELVARNEEEDEPKEGRAETKKSTLTFRNNIYWLVGGETQLMMKNTAKYIFQKNRLDLSDSELKAVEAKVLALARAEVFQ